MRPDRYFHAREIGERTWQIEYAFTDKENVYCYLIEGAERALLIDSMLGFGDLRSFVQGLTDKPVLLVNTHAHMDHTGGNFAFDTCYLHPDDLPYFYSPQPPTAAQFLQAAAELAKEGLAAEMAESDFFPEKPMRTLPVREGDLFDLGDRRVEVIEAPGHTPGSICLLDGERRALYTGDCCNSNTLLFFNNCLPVEEYLGHLLRLRARKDEFDTLWGGHEVFSPEIIDEGIELCARVLAGTDDAEERDVFGRKVAYGARGKTEGYGRADGKRFNIAYDPANRFGRRDGRQVIDGAIKDIM